MKFLHFTDIHLTTPGEKIGGRDPNANFERALDHALAHHGDAEALVITGDLSDWGDEADYVRLRDRIGALPMPARLCIGNHDDRSTFRSVFPILADPDGHVQYAFPLSAGTGIVIDTWEAKTHAGSFCVRRAAWLDATLTEASGPVYLFMHHNPVPLHIGPIDSIMLRDAEMLGEIIARHREKIAQILFGHCHLPLSGSFHGIPISAPRGTNHAGWASYGEMELLASSDLPEAYAVVVAQDYAVTITMVEYGYDGEVRVEGSPDYAAWDRATMSR